MREFTFQEACRFFGYKNRPLITVLPQDQLDCMGGSADLRAYCLKNVRVPALFVRALADDKKQIVQCEQSEHVSFKFSCKEKDLTQEYCFDAKGGCQKVGKRFANQLPLQFYSLTEESPATLSCEFATDAWVAKPLLRPVL